MTSKPQCNFLRDPYDTRTRCVLAEHLDNQHACPDWDIRMEEFETDVLKSYRASHQCICNLCDKSYGKHPFTYHLSYDFQPYLHFLCNGDIVKL